MTLDNDGDVFFLFSSKMKKQMEMMEKNDEFADFFLRFVMEIF